LASDDTRLVSMNLCRIKGEMIASHQHNFSASDLGAESDRAMLGQFDGERIRLWEVNRFSNGLVRLSDGLH
jgi:hypothetical protein